MAFLPASGRVGISEKREEKVARPEGVEPPTLCLEGTGQPHILWLTHLNKC